MDNDEARKLILEELKKYKEKSFADLKVKARENDVDTSEIDGPSGVSYQIEICFFRDGEGMIVVGNIDDKGWRAFFPLSESFFIKPDGTINK